MGLPAPVIVPADALAWLVRAQGLGEPHVVLAPAPRWWPEADRRELDESHGRAVPGVFGPVDRRGRLDVEVLASLAVLCRATTEYYGWISAGGVTTGVLAAAIGRESVLAVREGDVVRLSQIKATALAEELAARTPDVPAARGRWVVVDRADVRATTGGRQLTPSGVFLRPASEQVRLVQEIVALETTGCGELSVAVRDRAGRRRTCGQPLNYSDTVRGRFRHQVVGNGDRRLEIAPANRADLVARLSAMHRSLVD